MRGGEWRVVLSSSFFFCFYFLLLVNTSTLVWAQEDDNSTSATIAPVTTAPATTASTVTVTPNTAPSSTPSLSLSPTNTVVPSYLPSSFPSIQTSSFPSILPSDLPSIRPSLTNVPSTIPSNLPSLIPSTFPSEAPRNETTLGGACAGFIENRFSWQDTTGPFPIDCDNQTFSRWGPPEHQGSACCTDEGRYVVQLPLVGGFDITYRGGGPSGVAYRCLAYTEALRATLCDPQQGNHVLQTPTNTTIFQVCESSCDAVFRECGLPGDNYPSDLTYTDGASLCYAAWGGWYTTPCERNPDQFPCQVTVLDVVNDVTLATSSSSCLPIIYPTAETLEIYKETRQPPDECDPETPSRLGIFVVVVVTVVVSLTVCGALIYLNARHRQAEEDFS